MSHGNCKGKKRIHLNSIIGEELNFEKGEILTLSVSHITIASLSHLVKEVPLQELFTAQSLV